MKPSDDPKCTTYVDEAKLRLERYRREPSSPATDFLHDALALALIQLKRLEYLDSQHEQHPEPGRGGEDEGERCGCNAIEGDYCTSSDDQPCPCPCHYELPITFPDGSIDHATTARRKAIQRRALRNAGRKDSEPLSLDAGNDTPWPVRECLRRLADAADHLLDDPHGCNCEFHSTVRIAANEARRYLAEPPAQPEPAGGESEETVVSAWYYAAARARGE